MPRLRWLLVTLIALLFQPTGSAAGQQKTWFANLGLGPVLQDRQGSDALNASGLVVQGRVGRRLTSRLSALLEVTHTYVSRNDVARLQNPSFLGSVPCSEAVIPCVPGQFRGPAKTLVAGAGLQTSSGGESAALFASFTPGVYWLYDRAPGTRPVSFGMGAALGGTVRLDEHIWAIMDLHYHRLFSDGLNPRWLVPIGLGIQVR